MSDGELEKVYDDEVAPLMTQIIDICKRSGIAVYASFHLDEDLSCTTYIAPPASEVAEDDREGHDEFIAKHDPLARRATASPLMITTRNAKGDITQITAVL